MRSAVILFAFLALVFGGWWASRNPSPPPAAPASDASVSVAPRDAGPSREDAARHAEEQQRNAGIPSVQPSPSRRAPQASDQRQREAGQRDGDGGEGKGLDWPAWIQAGTAVASLLVSGTVLFVGIASLRVYRDQSATMKRQLEVAADATKAATEQSRVAERSLVVSQRPWLSVEAGPAGDLHIEEKIGFYLDINLAITNHGNSPALNTISDLVFVPGHNDIFAPQAKVADRLRNGPRSTDGRGAAIFPSQTGFASHQVNMGTAWKPESGYIQGRIVGCVCYTFPFGGKGRTDFAYALVQTKPSRLIELGYGYAIPYAGSGVAQADLALVSLGRGYGSE